MGYDRQDLISVIIPVYNMEDWLSRCLDPLLQSDYRALEILCIDDGSTDGSPSILRDYAQRDSRVRTIRTENGGVAHARNVGLTHAAGRFCTFLDSDDRLHPQFFSVMTRLQRQYGADIVSACFRELAEGDSASAIPVDPDSLSVSVFTGSDALRSDQIRVFVCCKLFRTDLVRDMRFNTALHYGEDTDFIIECYRRHPDIVTVAAPYALYDYFYRDGSATNSADYAGAIALYEHFYQKINDAADKKSMRWYMEELLRRSIAWIEVCDRNGADKEGAAFRDLADRARRLDKRYRISPFRQAVLYHTLIRFPALFRAYKKYTPGTE